jgi:hypothetical protein
MMMMMIMIMFTISSLCVLAGRLWKCFRIDDYKLS